MNEIFHTVFPIEGSPCRWLTLSHLARSSVKSILIGSFTLSKRRFLAIIIFFTHRNIVKRLRSPNTEYNIDQLGLFNINFIINQIKLLTI